MFASTCTSSRTFTRLLPPFVKNSPDRAAVTRQPEACCLDWQTPHQGKLTCIITRVYQRLIFWLDRSRYRAILDQYSELGLIERGSISKPLVGDISSRHWCPTRFSVSEPNLPACICFMTRIILMLSRAGFHTTVWHSIMHESCDLTTIQEDPVQPYPLA